MNDENYVLETNTEKVLMSDVLRDALPHVDGDAIIQATQNHYVAVLDVEMTNVNDRTVTNEVITGVLLAIKSEITMIQICIKIPIEDAMHMLQSQMRTATNVKVEMIELSSDTTNAMKFNVSNFALIGCELDGLNYEKEMCELTLKLQM